MTRFFVKHSATFPNLINLNSCELHFEQSCKCKNHEVIVATYDEDPYRVYTVESKDYPENHIII